MQVEIINIQILNGIINILMEQTGMKVEEKMEYLDLVESTGTKVLIRKMETMII